MEWTPLKSLFSNGNDSIVMLVVSFTSGVSFRYRSCYEDMLSYWEQQQMPKTYNNLKVEFLWLYVIYVIIMLCARFRVNLHSIFA